ncbi:hypothetical protein ABT024_23710 [Streptomyces sp. NPDC002812]|uniref:DUF6924 domain-containing protein n=1 Tax=Streptomyces sp. NPDC002812 TaxID=3154434 RepID=UPI0033234EE9
MPMPLPKPGDLTSLVLRTHFGDEAAWDVLRSAIDGACEYSGATYVSDHRFAGAEVRALVDQEVAAEEDKRIGHAFLADATAMADPVHLRLAVDLWAEPGRTFRVPVRWFPDVSANLSLSNMDFAEVADLADGSGVFRGFGSG